ncbi:MAG: OsmC family protein [Gammaproteobacteria bacterium]|nr:OsmC family protein [Gammaproteobacteria bacterium]MDH3467187.1 OsmC family protein [Gammaproteobacteria bacterium]
MKATVKWIDNVMFVGESGSGHGVVMDGSPEHGGRNMGIRPMELVLIGLGGCSSFDVVTILKKARQNVVDCRAELEAQRSSSIPAVFTTIHVRFVVTGKALKESAVERAVRLSTEKYCSATRMLMDGGVDVTHSYEILDAEPDSDN